VHRARRDLALGIDRHHQRAVEGAHDCLLRHGDRAGAYALFDAHAHVHAGQQHALRVRELRAQNHGARLRIDHRFREQQLPGLRVGAAVLGHQRQFCLHAIASGLAHDLAQPGHLDRRLRERHIDRIQLLHDCQRILVVRRHQRAFGDQRAADAARDRGGDGRVRQIESGRFQCRARSGDRGARSGHIGRCQPLCRLQVVEFLLADRIRLDQCLVAVDACGGLREVGLGARQPGFGLADIRLRAVVGCLIGRGIDLEQRLAGAYLAALAEDAPLHDAADTGADFGRAHGLDPPRQFADVRYLFGLDRDHRHHRWRRSACAGRLGGIFLLVSASGECERDAGDQELASNIMCDHVSRICQINRFRRPVAVAVQILKR